MAYRFSRFELILLAGLVITGLGIVTHYLIEGLEEDPVIDGPPPGDADQTHYDPFEGRTVYENKLPPLGWFVDDYFEGTSKEGKTIRGPVLGYYLTDREIKVSDDRSGDNRVLMLKNFPSYKIGRKPYDRSKIQEWEIHTTQTGNSQPLRGFLIGQNETTYTIKLESGYVKLGRDDIRKIVPVGK